MFLTSTDQLPCPAKRIVSLVPSQTELLFYLGLDAETIGITKFCVHPPEWHETKSKIGGTKNINLQAVRDLKPDLIICNIEENDQLQVELLSGDFPVWMTDVKNLGEAADMITDIGILTGKETVAAQLIRDIDNEFLSLLSKPGDRPGIRCAYLVWNEPYMTAAANTFINSMLQMAGFKNIFSHLLRYPEVKLADLAVAECELLLLPSEPYPFKQKHVDDIKAQFPALRIMLVDGEMFSWYGSRLLFAPKYFLEIRRGLAGKVEDQPGSMPLRPNPEA